jgi:hypothetical protein
METNSITNIILLVAIVFIAIGVTREQQLSQPIRERIRYIPRSLEEEAKEPVKVGDIFKSMFENQAPWIGNFNDKNVFLRKTLDKERDMLTNSKKKEKKLKISGNTVNTLSDEKISKNASSSQTIAYIADGISVNMKNCIKNNIKILIRIYIESKMNMKQEKKKIRIQEKDIGKRNELRNLLYTQRKIIQSIIFQYPIEVLLTYYIYSLYIILYFYFRMVKKIKGIIK